MATSWWQRPQPAREQAADGPPLPPPAWHGIWPRTMAEPGV